MTTPDLPQAAPKIAGLPDYSRPPAAPVPVTFRASSNESPLPPSRAAVDAAVREAAQGHLYPDITGVDLRRALSERFGLEPEQVAVGAGALALLDRLLWVYAGGGRTVVHPWRSYEAYPIAIDISDSEGCPVPLDPEHRLDLPAMAEAAVEHDAAIVILCNPNNPTGTFLEAADLESFLAAVPPSTLVLLDEAYIEFVPTVHQALQVGPDLFAAHPNLVVMRTFSKAYGLAGMRVGYAMGSARVMAPLAKAATPFPVGRVSLAAAVAAYEDREHSRRTVEAVEVERRRVTEVLAAAGVPHVPSAANFIWLPLGEQSEEFAARCAEAGILVRAFPGEGVRVTVGLPGLAEALAKVLVS